MMFHTGDKVSHKGRKCVVVFQMIKIVTIRFPDGEIKVVSERKLKKLEEF